MNNNTAVIPVTKELADSFILAKHYSHRPPVFWAGFGLSIKGQIEGVVIYGQPSPPIQINAFRDRDFRFYELSRLVIQTGLRNAASYLVAHSLQMLTPRPCAVISYADTQYHHCGFIYQATNWKYTGATVSHDHLYLVDGKWIHAMTLRDRGITNPKQWAREKNIQTLAPSPKHRYFFAVGSSRQCRRIWSKLAYPIIADYPKLDPARYDDGPRIDCPAPHQQLDLL